MKKYDSYKNIPEQWLTSIPSEWKTRKLKYCFKERVDKGHPDEPMLCSTQKDGVIPQSMYANRVVVVNKDFEKQKLVKVGDFVISLRSFQGGIEYAYYQGIISAAYTILEPKNNDNSEYFKYLFKSHDFIQLLQTCVTGIREGQNIDYFLLGRKFIPIPPQNEQDIIINYLKDRVSSICSFIAAKQRQVELLEEYKQAIIAQAVTRGLNPDVKMKFMDTPLQCKHPEHWKRVRNMSFMVEQSDNVGKNSNDFALLSLTTNGVILRDMESGKGKFPKDFESYSKVEPNEIIFCLFDIDETPRTVGLSRNYGMITGAYDIFKIKESLVLPEYVYYYYLAIDNIKALRPYYSGLRKVVKHNRFMQIGFPLPPMEEQIEIVSYVKAKSASIDNLKATITQEISLLQEYKQRLISDVVTGQINVQNEIV